MTNATQITQAYDAAKDRYAAIGVDTDAVLEKLQGIKIILELPTLLNSCVRIWKKLIL